MNQKKLIEKFYKTLNAHEWEMFAETLDQNIEYRVPQTRERVRGREAVLDFMKTFPGDWELKLVRVIATDDVAAVEVAFILDGTESINLAFLKIQNNLVTEIDDYWPEPYEPPARICKFVERY